MKIKGNRAWKILGLAGLTGVAATGAVIYRNNRVRASYTPDMVRQRLHERYESLPNPKATVPLVPATGVRGIWQKLLNRVLRSKPVHVISARGTSVFSALPSPRARDRAKKARSSKTAVSSTMTTDSLSEKGKTTSRSFPTHHVEDTKDYS